MVAVGITGASGSIIGVRLTHQLMLAGQAVMGIVSESAKKTMCHELRLNGPYTSLQTILSGLYSNPPTGTLKEYSNSDMFAPAASGTCRFEAMIVAPCSMKTLSAVANGYSESLIARAADVALKEGRKCVLVPRETPLSLVHCNNLLKAKQAGALIVPPVPAYYTFPKTIDDVTDFIVGRILDQIGIKHSLYKDWPQPSAEPTGR